MNRLILIVVLCLSINGYAQLLENKTNLSLSYQRALFMGGEMFNSKGTIAPSFYSNFKQANGLVVKETQKISDHISVGVSVGLLSASGWQSRNYASYDGSKSTTMSFQPVFQYHTKFAKSGLYNRLKWYGELSPVLGWSTLDISNHMFEIVGDKNPLNQVVNSNKLSYGVQVGVGGEYALTNKLGLLLNLSVQQSYIHSPMFIDNKYTLSSINIGMYYNLSKIKRFNY